MGCVLSWCDGNEKKENEELENKVKVLSKELSEVKIKNEHLHSSLRNISKETRFYMNETERLNKLEVKYKKVLTTESEKTADIIMSSTLRLEFMNDSIEKKHIRDVLQASYDMVNC